MDEAARAQEAVAAAAQRRVLHDRRLGELVEAREERRRDHLGEQEGGDSAGDVAHAHREHGQHLARIDNGDRHEEQRKRLASRARAAERFERAQHRERAQARECLGAAVPEPFSTSSTTAATKSSALVTQRRRSSAGANMACGTFVAVPFDDGGARRFHRK
jgi:hypothetical protein